MDYYTFFIRSLCFFIPFRQIKYLLTFFISKEPKILLFYNPLLKRANFVSVYKNVYIKGIFAFDDLSFLTQWNFRFISVGIKLEMKRVASGVLLTLLKHYVYAVFPPKKNWFVWLKKNFFISGIPIDFLCVEFFRLIKFTAIKPIVKDTAFKLKCEIKILIFLFKKN